MPSILAIAPSGAAAFITDDPSPQATPPGHRHEPHGDVRHWTPRRPVPMAAATNYTLEETPEETAWLPVPEQRLIATLMPEEVIGLVKDDTPLAERIAQLPAPRSYVMAVAAASMILHNITNGMAHARFPDSTSAYLIAETMEVRPTSA